MGRKMKTVFPAVIPSRINRYMPDKRVFASDGGKKGTGNTFPSFVMSLKAGDPLIAQSPASLREMVK